MVDTGRISVPGSPIDHGGFCRTRSNLELVSFALLVSVSFVKVVDVVVFLMVYFTPQLQV